MTATAAAEKLQQQTAAQQATNRPCRGAALRPIDGPMCPGVRPSDERIDGRCACCSAPANETRMVYVGRRQSPRLLCQIHTEMFDHAEAGVVAARTAPERVRERRTRTPEEIAR